ncbi:MAG: guanylate kinase [Dehalococcoidia bacterium]|nr:guanylate kinase [Dehalococcoidia bacterium]MCA9854641.1 guanylate kinase [Dehalococcoidia bacterium]
MKERQVVVILHGPSGVGKDAVVDALRERIGIHRATSTTSRAPRKGEENGVHYHFVSREEFEEMIAAGEFAEYAKVYQDWKGLERRELFDPLEEGRDVIIRTDVQGARHWRQVMEGAISIFLMAEDREALRARLIARNSEDPESLARREAELHAEMDDIERNDYVVLNRQGRIAEAVDEIAAIIEQERKNPDRPDVRLRVEV